MEAKDFKHGDKVTCIIHEDIIDDAMISKESGIIYICQNIKDGLDAENKLGYDYSWLIYDPSEKDSFETQCCKYNNVSELKNTELVSSDNEIDSTSNEFIKKGVARI